MPYLILKKITFEASHYIPEYKGKCASVHGHSYQLLNISVPYDPRKLDEQGIAIDFGVLKKEIKDYVDKEWDHKMIITGDMGELNAWKNLYTTLKMPDNLKHMEYTTAEAMASTIAYDLSMLLGWEPEEIHFELFETQNQGVKWP